MSLTYSWVTIQILYNQQGCNSTLGHWIATIFCICHNSTTLKSYLKSCWDHFGNQKRKYVHCGGKIVSEIGPMLTQTWWMIWFKATEGLPKAFSINSLSSEKYGSNSKSLYFKPIILENSLSSHREIALRWMPQNLTDQKSTLVQLMAWCLMAPSHYLYQCWLRSLMLYAINRPQWVQKVFVIDSDTPHEKHSKYSMNNFMSKHYWTAHFPYFVVVDNWCPS